jgi:hypothetical protein
VSDDAPQFGDLGPVEREFVEVNEPAVGDLFPHERAAQPAWALNQG